jgi:hypothetical protein
LINKLKYHHGKGRIEKSGMPTELMAAVSVRRPISNKIYGSYKEERIAELSGEYGDATVGDPPEVDVLALSTDDTEVSITVFNRGIMLLTSDDEKVRRLHRFFCTIEKELGEP